ncbi:hypothetical protein QPM17_04210 [Marinobacter sp. TBZ242]|uniref:Bacterial virulence factor lipase N-terminal domain-containing protein n=1 Tax=Marinobacter azerbaijanicus TaxID=3050455 RepID=A0ABT7I829_9GAMM|nr:hypothetical protein [Marinobacter sp. TBZ242]MDL0430314.1 hypothetical protein [Marinobacter sp. TBZ242]
MFKKTLISLAVASSLGLTGCFDSAGSGSSNADPDYKINNPDFTGRTWPIFDPLAGNLPIPSDLNFDSAQGDGTFGVPDSQPPVTTALNELSGASTVAPAVIAFNGRIDADTVVTGETVFLIELTYASGDPVQGLGNQEPPAPSAALSLPTPAYRADVVTLDGNSAIRILPLEPLNPRKRYVAVVTTGIEDVNGDAIVPSPFYGSLSDEEQPIGDSALAPVKALINGLWEPIAAAAGIAEENIALSYSFTTSNDEKVLQYIAEPAAWFSDQLKTFVKVAAATSAQEGGASSYAEVAPVVQGAMGAFPDVPVSETETFRDVLSDVFAGPCNGVASGPAAFDCTGVAITSQLVGLNADIFPTPIPGVNRNGGDISIDPSSVSPVGLVSAVAGAIPGSDAVLAAQGTVNLPYFLADSAPGVVTDSWKADSALAGGINDLFSGVSDEPLFAQGNPDVSTAVNYIFPFPERTVTGGVDVPVLALYPSDGNINGAVLYQHGITTDRSAALTFGTALAANGYAVIAIDQPLHGVAAFTDEEQTGLAITLLQAGGASEAEAEALAPLAVSGNVSALADALAGGTATPESTATAQSLVNTVANAGSTIPGLAPQIGNERHFGLYAPQPSVPTPIDYDAGMGDSGSLFINLTSFLTSRDNSRQSVMDQMNLRASLADPNPGTALELPGTDNTLVISAATPVYFAGHSLGTITGTPFVASVNENQISDIMFTSPDGSSSIPSALNDVQSASLLTPGGGVVRLLENSPSFAPSILAGLQQAAGLEQGDSGLEAYLNVFQAAYDTVDPVNFVDNLADKGTPTLLSQVVGDTVIPNGADEMLWGVPPLEGNLPLQVSPTQTINVTVDSFNAPLAGGFPLSAPFDANCFVEYDADGANHGTPTSADPASVFAQMVGGTVALYMGGACPPN